MKGIECRCGCGEIIENPRMAKGEIVQKFIDDKHRTRYHNKRKVRIDEIPDLLERAFENAKSKTHDIR